MTASAKFKLKALIPTETQEARALTRWCRVARYMGRPIADYLVMNANDAMGGIGSPKDRAIRMAHLKSIGLRVGASDYTLMIPRPPFHGLVLELKRTHGGVVSQDQTDYIGLMDVMGYATAISYGWERAKDTIEAYLAGRAI